MFNPQRLLQDCCVVTSVAVRGVHEKDKEMETAGFYSRPLTGALHLAHLHLVLMMPWLMGQNKAGDLEYLAVVVKHKSEGTFQNKPQCTHRPVPLQSGASASRRQTRSLLWGAGCQQISHHLGGGRNLWLCIAGVAQKKGGISELGDHGCPRKREALEIEGYKTFLYFREDLDPQDTVFSHRISCP